MNSKKKKGTKDINDFAIHFDVEPEDHKQVVASPITQQRETQALKTINYLELENNRLEKLFKFIDGPLQVQMDTEHAENLLREVNLELMNVKAEITAKLAADSSPLFKNLEFLWDRTYL